MEPEIIEEEVVVVEPPVEEPVPEETPTEEEPATEPTDPMAEVISRSITFTNTRSNLLVIAEHRGYPIQVPKPDVAPDAPLQDRYMTNPLDPIEWLFTVHIPEVNAKMASDAFLAEAKRQAQIQLDAQRDYVEQMARQSIS